MSHRWYHDQGNNGSFPKPWKSYVGRGRPSFDTRLKDEFGIFGAMVLTLEKLILDPTYN